MAMTQQQVLELIGDSKLIDQWMAERDRLDRIDNWLRWNHDLPHQPRHATTEYKELAARSQTPWLALVVTSVAQALYVEGYRKASDPDNADLWRVWQANGLDSRQIAVHRAALAYGATYVTVLPGETLTGEKMPAIRGVSPRKMMAFYGDPAEDDWPTTAMRVDVISTEKWRLRLYDDKLVHHLTVPASGGTPEYVKSEAHGVGFCPVVRFTNSLDLEGRTDGEVEPYIPLASRTDQTTFDRLVVQRFASWKVRTIAGMAKPEEDTDAAAEKLRLRVEDLLIAEDKDTKFGVLDATDLSGFLSAYEQDIKTMAAVTQTPAHEMLGTMANLSAEALAAARASLMSKVDERKHSFGESWEQTLRAAAVVANDTEAARDYEAQVRWKDTEIRSLSQAADALGKIAEMLGVPVQMLWEKIPGWTEQDVARAKILFEQGDGMKALMDKLVNGQTPPELDRGG